MTDQRLSERSIFEAAIEKGSPTARAAYLDQACGGDAGLRREVEALLEAHDRLGSFDPAARAPDPVATVEESAVSERPGTVVGPYKLLEQIGEGSYGIVFLAEQQQPVRRRVALKVLKPGMDTRQVVARFEAERQALALMDSENIARVLDGGQTASGRPYFVMELVRGAPITDFCDSNRLGVPDRLELFGSVCRAVQHAHQKGVIHRDLKPSNVLVALHDGTPVPKVIDFGIAKALGQPLTDKTLNTGCAQMVGTPLYMSPEQTGLSNADVDTRSDVYSLGVLLYELLTGTTPFTRERFKEAGYDEIRRVIREEEPPRPSARLSTLGQAAATISAQRKSDPKRLSQLFRGELDWVAMKALEKDRSRRYDTASAFAADVQRYLNDDPVLACPPSAWYRLRKFARRNKRALAVAGLILFFIVLLGAGAWGYQHERAAQAGARAVRQRETERGVTAALAKAEAFLAEGDRQLDYPARWQATLVLAESAIQRAEGLTASGEPTEELALQVRQVRKAVDAALRDCRVLAELDRIHLEKYALKKGSPFDRGRRLRSRGVVLLDFDRARAARQYAAVLGSYGVNPAAPEEAAARVRGSRLREALLAALEDWWGVTRDAAQRRRLEVVLQAVEPAPSAFRARWRAARRAKAGAVLARMAREPGVQDLPAAAIASLAWDLSRLHQDKAAERLLRASQERHRDSFWINYELGVELITQNPPRPREAIPYFTAALALRSDVVGVYLNLGNALSAAHDLPGEIREYQAALRIDPNSAPAHCNLGSALLDANDLAGATREYQAALEIDSRCALARDGLSQILYRNNDLEGAIRELRIATQIDPDDAPFHHHLGILLYERGDWQGARSEFEAALKIDPKRFEAHSDLGNALGKLGDRKRAIREYRAALEIDPNYALAHYCLGNTLLAERDWDEAIREYLAALEIDPKYIQARVNLGCARAGKGDREGAIREYKAALKINPKFARAHLNLGNALRDQGDWKGAIREYRVAVANDDQDAGAHFNLGCALHHTEDLEGAIRSYLAALRINPRDEQAHYSLGNALSEKGELEAAVRSYRDAIGINPKFAEAHCNLGQALKRLGRFTEALAAFKTGDKLGHERPGWSYPSATWVREVELLVALDAKLPKVLRKASKPANARECANLAWLCRWEHKQLNASAARFFMAAFKDDPKLAEETGRRCAAARAAALAGCGQGKDADQVDEQERACLRRQALDWLRADLTAWRKRLEKEPGKMRPVVFGLMGKWQRITDFGGVRGTEALTRLPEAERRQWQAFWADVEALRQRAAERK
jgi:tetratricopeptide (TPR) repeat protein/tRNA A-37 threonylcarbamoyl transferase component Bud32